MRCRDHRTRSRRILAGLTLALAAAVALPGVERAASQHVHPGAAPAPRAPGVAPAPGVRPAPEAKPAAETAYYTCPMHPSVRAAAPGQCPICGMDLVAVAHGEVGAGAIVVDDRRRQMIGLTTAPAARRPLVVEVRALGRVAVDETALTDVSLRSRGWVGEIRADFTGMTVRKGEILATVYSPELAVAEAEYLESVRTAERNPRLAASARRRLALWGLDAAAIDALARGGQARQYVPIPSPVTGTVVEKRVVAGSGFEAGAALYRIADLSRVWIEAEVYESDLPLVAVGQEARVTLPYLPGTVFAGALTFVYPTVDTPARTGRIRLEVANPDGALKPAMYADVRLAVPLGEALTVPDEAVIRSGTRSIVFVDRGEGRLEPREVEIGRRGEAGREIREGLEAGELVVTSGTFLISSESKLKSAVEEW